MKLNKILLTTFFAGLILQACNNTENTSEKLIMNKPSNQKNVFEEKNIF